MPRTRLAPSPTGALHLGNARTFAVNWALARQCRWEIVLRIEDLDGPRVRAGAAELAIEDLAWLGLDWDAGPIDQCSDLAPYRDALVQLASQRDIYPCRCTRRQIEAAALSAPHADEHELRYPGVCRPDFATPLTYDADDASVAWRLRTPDEASEFVDQFAGVHRCNVQAATGDFLVATKAGLPSYQLAVVVDDARQGIDRVVRGDDLLASTHRQRLIAQRLAIATPTAYYHLPLVRGADGRRLAKRHGDTRVAHYRALGVSAARIWGLLSEWCGLGPRRECSAAEFCDQFTLEQLPRNDITFTEADDHWLRGAK
ncbi:MAG: tRNA glutamyl-Q(34) synthetase GluQRS [Planctomycetales bacterium]|nr:tRNA glutamyl-Q(34) synthetase GluQRS [Planctomycetales bacterium]